MVGIIIGLGANQVYNHLPLFIPRAFSSRRVLAVPRLDAIPWKNFRRWAEDEMDTLKLRIEDYTTFEHAFPTVDFLATSSEAELLLLPSLAREVLTQSAALTKENIAAGTYGEGLSDTTRDFCTQIQHVWLRTAGEGLVDILAVQLSFLLRLGYGSNDEFACIGEEISLKIGSAKVSGKLDLVTKTRTDKLYLEIFENKIDPKAGGYKIEGRGQIAGYLLASCIRNLGQVPEKKYQEQESFLINIKGTFVHIFHLSVSVPTILAVKSGAAPPIEESIISMWPKIGCGLNLMDPVGRQEAFLAIRRVHAYVRSNKAKIGFEITDS